MLFQLSQQSQGAKMLIITTNGITTSTTISVDQVCWHIVPNYFYLLTNLFLTTMPLSKCCYYLHLTEEEVKVERSEVKTCPLFMTSKLQG